MFDYEVKDFISVFLEHSLCSVYCDTCHYNDGKDDVCEYCHRKSMSWSLSRQYADILADGVFKIFEEYKKNSEEHN